MKLKTIFLAIVLADFTALTIWAFSGLTWATLSATLSTPLGMQMAADIVLALSVAMGFIWHDAKKRGIRPAGWMLLTLLTGSIGPLAYLLRREWAPRQCYAGRGELTSAWARRPFGSSRRHPGTERRPSTRQLA